MTFLIQQTLIYAVPLMIVALAGVFAERSGIINLALEGIMIFGAFTGVLFVNLTQKAGIFAAAKAADNWVALQGFELLAMLVAAVLGAALWVQIVLFFVVSIAALAATRPLVQKMLHRDETPTNADRVLGQTARVTETIDNTVPTGAVYADGKTWTARSASGRVIPKDTLVKVQRMEGVRLFVEEEAGQPVHS